MSDERVRIAIAGVGERGRNAYGKELVKMKDRVTVTAVADTNEERLGLAGDMFGVPSAMRFHSAEEMLSRDRLADAVFICTQDRQHVSQAVAALRKGYDVLLEKPVSPDLEDLGEIVRVQKETGRRVVVCHVLRYTPFFQMIKKTIESGRLGEVVAIQALENVCYWHQAHSYVRGNWRREAETSPMILAKCCHDLDYLVWLSGRKCERVSSLGSLMYFRPENAPDGAALRCTDCRAKASCPYDAEKIYLTNPETGILHGNTGWPVEVLAENPTEEKIRLALERGPYGRCVFHSDNDVVDHQTVNMEMEGGATLTLTMCAFTSNGGREIKVMGTLGDLKGDMNENRIRITRFGEKTEEIDLSRVEKDDAGHGGGDALLVGEFISLLEGKDPDDTVTTLERSVESHLIAIAAERSRLSGGRAVEMAPLRG